MNRFILVLCLLFAGCFRLPPPRFAAGDVVEVKVDHHKGVVVGVWDEFTPSYNVRYWCDSGYQFVILNENELSKARP